MHHFLIPSKSMKIFCTSFILLTLCTSWNAWTDSHDDPDPSFDRLDGQGPSGKKVDVIEWENNLEIHVYPAGSIAGIGLKLDDSQKNKKVMVISFRFQENPQHSLIRRAILGIPLQEGFRAYQDPRTTEYDKIVVSQHLLGKGSPLVAFRLDPPPQQLYPEGHPSLGKTQHAQQQSQPQTLRRRQPASWSETAIDPINPMLRDKSHPYAPSRQPPPPPALPRTPVHPAQPGSIDENGTILPFRW